MPAAGPQGRAPRVRAPQAHEPAERRVHGVTHLHRLAARRALVADGPRTPSTSEAAEDLLERDHYGLAKVKKRIVEYLAVRKLKGDMKGPILCLVGPPGVGKTSLGKSIARALGRKFVRISPGRRARRGRDPGPPAHLRRRLPGRIIQALKRAGTMNPVLVLDEIDKLGNDFRGDPASRCSRCSIPSRTTASATTTSACPST
jgi:ABC-type glutathione transport system ATPase component